MTRAWFSVLPLLALTSACAPKSPRGPAVPSPTARSASTEPPALTAGPTWDPPATVPGVHIHPTCRPASGDSAVTGCKQLYETEATFSGDIDAKGPPTARPLKLAVGHCYQLSVTLEGPLADAHFALVDARGHFAAASDAPAPVPTLFTRTLTVPHNGALCINSPTELSLSAAAGSGSGKFEATLVRVK